MESSNSDNEPKTGENLICLLNHDCFAHIFMYLSVKERWEMARGNYFFIYLYLSIHFFPLNIYCIQNIVNSLSKMGGSKSNILV